MNIKPYKCLCAIKVLCSIQNLLYMVVGSSVSWKNMAMLPEFTYMIIGLSVSLKTCDTVFLNICTILIRIEARTFISSN